MFYIHQTGIVKQTLGLNIRSFPLTSFWNWKPKLSCTVVSLLTCHGKMRLVERVRIGENMFWKQPQTVFGVLFYICMKDADRTILRPSPVCSKLRQSLMISGVLVSCFSSWFLSFPDAFRCVWTCFGPSKHTHCSLLCNHKLISIYQNSFSRGTRTMFNDSFQWVGRATFLLSTNSWGENFMKFHCVC